MTRFQPPSDQPLESGLRELEAPNRLLKPRDKITVWVSAETWTCPFCVAQGRDGAGTTVDWYAGPHDGPDGRCRVCGANLRLARAGERVHDPLEQQQGRAPE